jgi:hypothetical protein
MFGLIVGDVIRGDGVKCLIVPQVGVTLIDNRVLRKCIECGRPLQGLKRELLQLREELGDSGEEHRGRGAHGQR